MISFEPLFHTLIEKGMGLTELTERLKISSSVRAKFKKNEHVSTATLVKICRILNCKIEDVIKYIPDENKKDGTEI